VSAVARPLCVVLCLVDNTFPDVETVFPRGLPHSMVVVIIPALGRLKDSGQPAAGVYPGTGYGMVLHDDFRSTECNLCRLIMVVPHNKIDNGPCICILSP
jgi:hypothetical protein